MNSRGILLGAVVLAALAVAVFVSLDDRSERASRDDARASSRADFARSRHFGEALVLASAIEAGAPHSAPEDRPSELLPADESFADAAAKPPPHASSDADQHTVARSELAEPHSAQANERKAMPDQAPSSRINTAPQLRDRNIVLSERIRKIAAQRGLDAGVGHSPLNAGEVSAAEWKRRLFDFRRTQTQ